MHYSGLWQRLTVSVMTMAKRKTRRHISRYVVENVMAELYQKATKREVNIMTKDEFRQRLIKDLGAKGETV